MIISGGFNVYPGDIEAVLRKHAAVVEVAVIGIPSEQWGETPMALCVRRDRRPDPARPGSRDWANARLGRTQRPGRRGLVRWGALPSAAPSARWVKRPPSELRKPCWAGRSGKDLRAFWGDNGGTDAAVRTISSRCRAHGRSDHGRGRRDALWPPAHRHRHRRQLRPARRSRARCCRRRRRLAAAAPRRHPDARTCGSRSRPTTGT